MKIDPRNIDELFKEHLSPLREKPPVYAWDRLNEDLLHARRSRKAALYRWIAAAAAIVIAFVTGYYFALNNINTHTNAPVAQQQEQQSEHSGQNNEQNDTYYAESATTSVIHANIDNPETIDGLISQKSENKVDYTPYQNQPVPVAVSSVQPFRDALKELTGIESILIATLELHSTPEIIPYRNSQQISSAVFPEEEKTNPVAEITKHKEFVFGEEKTSQSKWSIGGNFSPLYSYRNINIQAEDLPPTVIADENYYNTVENGLYSFTGGVDVEYQIKNSLSFLTGLYYSKSGQANKDVIAFQYPDDKYQFYLSSSTGIITINTETLPDKIAENSIRRDTTEDLLYVNTSIYQNFETIEIPLMLHYRLMKKRFGLYVSGGISPGLLVGKSAFVQYEDIKFNLDREGDFYPVVYNGVLGIGVDYTIARNLQLHLAPTFKHSIYSIRKDHSIEYYPYSFSLNTGLRYRF